MAVSEYPAAAGIEPPVIPLQQLDEPVAAAHGVQLSIARLDLIDPLISGNKWFKLLPNLELARQRQSRRILSFGGPWSNHIHALAWAGRRFGFETVGFIRGYAELALTAALRDAQEWGMQLHFLDHANYAKKHDQDWLDALQQDFGPCLVVPEGGCNGPGIEGGRRILPAIESPSKAFTSAVLAFGTGATLAGLLLSPGDLNRILGVSVLKGDAQARRRLLELHPDLPGAAIDWEIETGCHFGGYARIDGELKAFIENFYHRHGIALEPVYTGKMMYALHRRLQAGWFAPGEHVLALHTGGMQGLRGFSASWPWAAAQLQGTTATS